MNTGLSDPAVALLAEVRLTLGTIRALLGPETAAVSPAAASIRGACERVERRLARDDLAVVIVGEKKAGKSTFLNAIMGERVLGAAARECTGTVTWITYGERPHYVAQLADGTREEFLVRPLEHEDARQTRFLAEVHDLTDLEGRGAAVTELRLTYPGRSLPPGLVLIDTPGVNTDHEASCAHAWRTIREEADGCMLLCDLQQVLSRSTRDFLGEVGQILPHVLLVLTKRDRALANASGVGGESPANQVAEARRIGIGRFAKAIGRGPDEVLALTVAAEPALDDEGEWAAFDVEVKKLFALIANERAALVATRAEAALYRCLAPVAAARDASERATVSRLAALEAHRIEKPEDFIQESLVAVGEPFLLQADELTAAVTRQVRIGLARLAIRWEFQLEKSMSKEELEIVVAALGANATSELTALVAQARAEVAPRLQLMLTDSRKRSQAGLRERYDLARAVVGDRDLFTLPDAPPDAPDQGLHVQAGLEAALFGFHDDQRKFGIAGAAAGAALGTVLMPGVGTVLGALAGSFAGLFMTLEVLKVDCKNQLVAALGRAETDLCARLKQAGMAFKHDTLAWLGRDLEHAVERFQDEISAVLAREEERIAIERQRLADLIAGGPRLEAHRAELERLRQATIQASRGLCATRRAP